MSSLHTYTLPPHLIGVINVLIKLTAVIISKYISNHHTIHVEYTLSFFVNYTSIKLRKTKLLKIRLFHQQATRLLLY